MSAAQREAQARRLRAAWKTPEGWRYWSAVNNTEVGLWYTAVAFVFMLFAGVLALLMRVQLAVPDNDFVSAELYNQLYTLHGSVMMFLFAVPVFEAFSILVLPQMLGARDLPFPRLSAFGFWCFVIGGIFVCGSIFFNAAPQGGWFMYPPLNTTYYAGVGPDIWLLGLSFIEIASIAAAVELIVGVLKCRPPGMRINLIPLYCWYILVVAGMILFAFPPLIAGDLLFELQRAFDWPFFDTARGGDPLLWQHLFWIFGHPEVYIIFLPAIALVATIVPTFAQRPLVGYSWIVLAAVGTGFLSFGLWIHHMYTTGLPGVTLGFFSAASVAVAIPTGVQIFAFIATVLAGRVILSVPMLYVAGALAIFVIGGLTGVMLALVPFDWQAHDSYFVVAHLHHVLIGGMLFPVAAGFHYFFPLATGKHLSAKLGRIAFWLMFVGFNVAFLPMHLTGLLGMPRRVFTYGAGLGFDRLNLISTVGAFVFATGILVFVWDVVRPKRAEPYAKRNPWRAGTLEWVSEMPGEAWGIRSIPPIRSRYPLWEQDDLFEVVDSGRGLLPDAEEGQRETLITTAIDAEPVQVLRVPGPTWVTIWAALFTGGVFVFATYHWWWATLVAGVLALVAILVWLWTGTAPIPEKRTKPIGDGRSLPLYSSGSTSVGWWGMLITMLASLTAYAGLVFGYFYFWTIHDDFPPPSAPGLGPGWALATAAAVLGSWVLTLYARRANRRPGATVFHLTLFVAALLSIAGTVTAVSGPWRAGLDPVTHVYPATVWVLVGWSAAHAAVGTVMQLYCIARRAAGRLTGEFDIDIQNVGLYWHFVVIKTAITLALVAVFPSVA